MIRKSWMWVVFFTLISVTVIFSVSADACYNTVEGIPATCTGGSISSDTWNGCRQILCEGSGSSMQILACDKTGFFEMYKQTTVGSGVNKICIGSTCISDGGYAKSANFPICTATPSPNTTCTPTSEVCDQKDNDCDNLVDENNVCGGTACYAKVQDMPLTCDGTVTQDTFNGCRQVVCTNGGNSIQILACDKPTAASAEYFEMYRQNVAGTPPKVCLGPTCMQNEGFKQSGHYPLCMNAPACTPSTEICDQKDNDCDAQIDEGGVCTQPPVCSPTTEVCDQKDNDCDGAVDENNVCGSACYNNIQNIPASCTGGSITSDTFDGCRKILCNSASGSLQALACDKPGSHAAEYFELYRQAFSGSTPIQVCVGSTCVSDSSDWKSVSGNYPICTGNTTNPPACTPTTETCNQKDDDCDGQVDEGNVCAPPTNTCYNKISELPASCNGGTLVEDTVSGTCRKLVCTVGSARMQVLACDKSGFFEMYKQEQVGTQLEVCLASTCISNTGYQKSGSYPICTGTSACTPSNGGVEICDQQDNNCNGQTDENNVCAGATGFVWIEPSENQQNTPPNFFHLNVEVPSTEAQITKGEWEVWNNAMTERVWLANNSGSLRFHTHTPDGTFQGSLAGKTQLNYATTYKVRTRWHYTNGTVSAWSSTRTFTTSSQQTGGPNPWTIAAGFQVERVATGFDKPIHIAFVPRGMYDSLPDSMEPYYYVTELYGTVKVVHKDGSIGTYATDILNFDPFGSLTGGGQMGTIGLYVDDVTGDLFVGTVYVENDQVKNKVIKFTSADNGNTYTGQQTILSGLPSAPSHQIEQISKGPDGRLYVALGDALNSANAQSDTILAGKIIRMNMDGSGVQVYAKGLRNPFGHDWRPGTNQLFSTDNSPDTNDRLLKINQGENYLWGQSGSGYVGKAIDLLNPSPVDVEFNPGNSGFPSELTGKMYVAVAGPIYAEGPTNGKQIIEYTLDAAGNIVGEREFMKYSGVGYSTPIGMDFGPDGLYFTDIYGESGAFDPPEGAIFKITPGTGGCVNCGAGTFRAGINIVNWYPKYKEGTNQLEYLFECNGIAGSGNYKYDFEWGDGSTPSRYGTSNRQTHLYSRASGPFTVTCIARDQTSGQTSAASMQINPRDFVDDGVPGNDY